MTRGYNPPRKLRSHAINTRLTEELYTKLKAEADRRSEVVGFQVTLSQLVAALVEKGLCDDAP